MQFMAGKGRWVLLAGCAATLLAVAGCGGAPNAPAAQGGEQKAASTAGSAAEKEKPKGAKPLPGYPAPDIAAIDIATNEPVKLSSLKGQVVLINFWASWCQPCRREMPDLEAFHQEAKGKVRVLAIDADIRESAEQMSAFAKAMGLTFPILKDVSGTKEAYQVYGIPTSIFIDQNGIVRSVAVRPLALEEMRTMAAETAKLGQTK